MSFHLKYLFTVGFADGTTLEQTPEDQSTIDPERRSAWYDVVNRGTPVHWIVIHDESGNELGVDLTDGHFEINGDSFWLEVPDEGSLEPVFYRQHTHNFNVEGQEEAHLTRYVIGWKQGDKERTIGVY